MTFPRSVIVRLVREALDRRPGRTRSDVAARIGVDRHTLTRALQSAGTSFRAEQDLARLRKYQEVNGMLLTRTQLAQRLEFASVRALRAWEGRVSPLQTGREGDRSA